MARRQILKSTATKEKKEVADLSRATNSLAGKKQELLVETEQAKKISAAEIERATKLKKINLAIDQTLEQKRRAIEQLDIEYNKKIVRNTEYDKTFKTKVDAETTRISDAVVGLKLDKTVHEGNTKVAQTINLNLTKKNNDLQAENTRLLGENATLTKSNKELQTNFDQNSILYQEQIETIGDQGTRIEETERSYAQMTAAIAAGVQTLKDQEKKKLANIAFIAGQEKTKFANQKAIEKQQKKFDSLDQDIMEISREKQKIAEVKKVLAKQAAKLGINIKLD